MIKILSLLAVFVFAEFAMGQIQSQETAEILSTEIDRANTGRISQQEFGSQPKELWKYSGQKLWLGGIAIYNDVLVAIDRQSNRLIGIDANTGEELWERSVGAVFSYGMGLVMTCDEKVDAVVVGCDSGLMALERKTGELIWEYKTELGCSGPTIAGGLVLAGGADGKVHAVDLLTGAEKWKHDYMKDAPEDPPGFDGERARFTGRPARPQDASTDGETVFVSIFDQCRTLAVDVDSGERKWAFQTKGWTRTTPTITEDSVFIASQDKHFYAIDKATGEMEWSIESMKWNSTSAAVTEEYVVFGSNDGHIYCILREMGASTWEYDLTLGGTERTGIYSRPLIVGGSVYAAAMKGTLHAIDLESGKLKWKFKPSIDSEISGDLHFDDGKLYLFTRKSGEKGEAAIYAFRARTQGEE